MPSDAPSPRDPKDRTPDSGTHPSPIAAWPPPGLERVQGDLWNVIERLSAGGAVLSLPLLAALTIETDPWGPGIFGSAWWVLILTTVVALGLLMSGYVQLYRALTRWRHAARQGYADRTVAMVLSDGQGDMGFLVQGARAYSSMSLGMRRGLVTARLLRASLLVAAALWLSAGFTLGVVLAARGVFAEGGLVLWTLAPPSLAGFISLFLQGWDEGEVLKARKTWYAQEWAQDLAREDVVAWHEAVSFGPGSLAPAQAEPGRPSRGLWAGGVLTAITGVTVVFLSTALPVVSGVGAIITELVTPRFTSLRAARASSLAHLEMPVDSTISLEDAGAAYRSMILASSSLPEMWREPERQYEAVFTDYREPVEITGVVSERWARDLMPRLSGGLEPEVLSYLREKGQHPALAEFGVLARAGGLDEFAALYRLPFREDMTWWEIPIPTYREMRALTMAHIGGAIADAADGKVEDAETRLREVISVGLLMTENGTNMISASFGASVAEAGGEALMNLYDALGRADEAETLGRAMGVAERAAEIASSVQGDMGTFAALPATARNTNAVRGLRWELVGTAMGVSSCANLNRVVFGPPDEYHRWVRDARTSLVRSEGDAELFRVLERGLFLREDSSSQPVADFFGLVMGGGIGSCAGLLEDLRM